MPTALGRHEETRGLNRSSYRMFDPSLKARRLATTCSLLATLLTRSVRTASRGVEGARAANGGLRTGTCDLLERRRAADRRLTSFLHSKLSSEPRRCRTDLRSMLGGGTVAKTGPTVAGRGGTEGCQSSPRLNCRYAAVKMPTWVWPGSALRPREQIGWGRNVGTLARRRFRIPRSRRSEGCTTPSGQGSRPVR